MGQRGFVCRQSRSLQAGLKKGPRRPDPPAFERPLNCSQSNQRLGDGYDSRSGAGLPGGDLLAFIDGADPTGDRPVTTHPGAILTHITSEQAPIQLN